MPGKKKRAGGVKGDPKRTRVTVRISERLADYLDAAASLGVHGSTQAEVARKFIENEVERLIRDGLIRIKPPLV